MRHGAWQSAILRLIFRRVTLPTQVMSLPFLREVTAHGGSHIPRIPLPHWPRRSSVSSRTSDSASRRLPMSFMSSTLTIPQDARRAHHPLIALDIELYWASRWEVTRQHIALCASSGERRGLFG